MKTANKTERASTRSAAAKRREEHERARYAMKTQVLELVERLERDEVAGVLIVTAEPNGAARHSWAFGPSAYPLGVVGALEVVKARLVADSARPKE